MEYLKRRLRQRRNALESEFNTPEKFFKHVWESFKRYVVFVGCERFEPDYSRWNPRFVFLIVDILAFLVICSWCIVLLWGQLVGVIFCLATFGIGLQGCIKAYILTNHDMYKLHHYNVKRFRDYGRFPEVREALMNTAFVCQTTIEVMAICYPLLGASTVLLTVVIAVASQRFELPFGFFIPGTDMKTLPGYLLNFAYHVLQMTWACIGLLVSDILFFIIMFNAIGQLDVILVYLRNFGKLTAKASEPENEIKIYQLLNELIEKHVEHKEYLLQIDDLMKAGFFINFRCLIAETVMCLYVNITVDGIWFPGLIIALANNIQLGIPCFLGSLLSSKNDSLIDEIYNVPWNELPIPAQKILQIFLHHAQNPVVLSDGFVPIDLYNFMEIHKKMYSYLTMLQSFR